jgi:hypothetical protein
MNDFFIHKNKKPKGNDPSVFSCLKLFENSDYQNTKKLENI